jgi:HSP20 family protein
MMFERKPRICANGASPRVREIPLSVEEIFAMLRSIRMDALYSCHLFGHEGCHAGTKHRRQEWPHVKEGGAAHPHGAEMKIRFRTVDSVLDDIEVMQRRITERAQKIFRERGGALGHAVEDWLKAERETIWRPALEVRRTKDAFVVEAAVAGLDPKQFDVRVTPTELLLAADVHHLDREQEGEVVLCEFIDGPLFRSYRFPEPIDPGQVTAEYRNGLLRVTAPLAHPAKKVEIHAV